MAVVGQRRIFQRTSGHTPIHLKTGKLSVINFFPLKPQSLFKEDSTESLKNRLLPHSSPLFISGNPQLVPGTYFHTSKISAVITISLSVLDLTY